MSSVTELLNQLFDKFLFLDNLACFLVQRVQRRRILTYREICDIHPTVILGDVFMDANVSIGKGTYINDGGQLFAGANSSIKIGCFCAIGYNVHIKARSHDPIKPTRSSLDDQHLRIEAGIVIGDQVWIGDNVFIGPGICVGNHAIIGSNAVVTHNVADYAIVGGVPARLIRMRSPTLPRKE